MRLHRSGNTPDRYLVWKVALFFAAAAVWAIGVAAGEPRLTAAAIVLVAAALLLRFLPGRDPADDGEA